MIKSSDRTKIQNFHIAFQDFKVFNLSRVRLHQRDLESIYNLVGAKEQENRTVTIRRLGSEKQEVVSLDDLVKSLTAEATMPHLGE